jgi:hypothetical protein
MVKFLRPGRVLLSLSRGDARGRRKTARVPDLPFLEHSAYLMLDFTSHGLCAEQQFLCPVDGLHISVTGSAIIRGKLGRRL